MWGGGGVGRHGAMGQALLGVLLGCWTWETGAWPFLVPLGLILALDSQTSPPRSALPDQPSPPATTCCSLCHPVPVPASLPAICFPLPPGPLTSFSLLSQLLSSRMGPRGGNRLSSLGPGPGTGSICGLKAVKGTDAGSANQGWPGCRPWVGGGEQPL